MRRSNVCWLHPKFLCQLRSERGSSEHQAKIRAGVEVDARSVTFGITGAVAEFSRRTTSSARTDKGRRATQNAMARHTRT